MDRNRVLQCATIVGAELYGDESSKRRTGRSFTYEQLMSFADLLETHARVKVVNEITDWSISKTDSTFV